MKNILILILLINTSSIASNNIQIAVNPIECINCTNKINLLSKVDQSKTNVHLIFPQGYEKEKSSIVKKLGIKSNQYNIIFSDNLYKKIMGNETSSKGLFYSGNGVDTIFFDLKNDLDNNFIQKVNSMSKNESILISKNNILSQSSLEMRNSNGIVYSLNRLDNTIYRIDISNDKSIPYFSLDKKIVKIILNSQMKDEMYFDNRETIFNENGVFQKDEIIEYQIYNESACVVASHKFLTYEGPDTFLSSFYSLIFIENGEINSIQFLDIENDGYIFFPINFYFRNNKLSISSYKSCGYQNNKLFKVVEFSYYKNEKIKNINSYIANRNDSIYNRIQFNILTSIVYNDHIFHTSSNEIYNFINQEKTQLDFIPVERTDGVGSTRMNVFDFKIFKEFIYVYYCDFQEKNAYYIKYSTEENKIVDKYIHSLQDNKLLTSLSIDNFDFNYLWIPIENNSLVRKKVLIN